MDKRLKILLTPDGKGIQRKAEVLLEILDIAIPDHRIELRNFLNSNKVSLHGYESKKS